MAIKKDRLIEIIALKENAQFYIKEPSGYYSENRISNIFNETSAERVGNPLLNIKKYCYDDEAVEFSLCVFKLIHSPSFISEDVPGWLEQKIGYILIIDLADYVIVFKKNAASSDLFDKGTKELDYKVLATIFFDDGTVVEKVSMNNSSVLQDAVSKKVYEANNLQNSLSTYGLGKYMVNSLRVNNASEKTSVTFNTSRVTNYGEKKGIYDLTVWVKYVVDKIRNYSARDTFIDIFAEPIEYESVYTRLTPISILISAAGLLEEYESGNITDLTYTFDGRTRSLSINKMAKSINRVFSVDRDDSNPEHVRYFIDTTAIDQAEVLLNAKSITIKAARAAQINVVYEDGSTTPLLRFLNSKNDYIVNFEDLEVVYYQRKLFKDRGLLNAVEVFMSAFQPVDSLNDVNSEKGRFTPGCVEFSERSLFGYIDRHIVPTTDYAFLDDLGDEWADFITITANKLCFIHAKHKDSIMSATDFQDVVSQAMKNIGNFKPTTERITINKRRMLESNYRIDGVTTAINRLRKGASIDAGIDAYTKLLSDPNFQREIILVVNFISKDFLGECLEKLRDGEVFRERNQVIQVLWLISGLINCCMENGVRIYIYCKP